MLNRKLNILFLPSDKWGVFNYRVRIPAKYLDKMNLANTRIIYEEEFNGYDIAWADIIVCQRKWEEKEYKIIVEQTRELSKSLKKSGIDNKKIIVFDTDDYLEGIPKSNPSYASYHTGTPAMIGYQKWLKTSDGLTVSTSNLLEKYHDSNNNIHIYHNAIDPDDWNFDFCGESKAKKEKEIKIGFAGSDTHYDDLAKIKSDLAYILKMYKNVTLHIFGGTTSPTKKNNLRHLFSDFPKNRVSFYPMVPVKNYPLRLYMLNLDIGICPLVNDCLNQAKSAIKFYEYTLSGASVIADSVGEYRETIENGKNGILVPQGKSWIPYLLDLIKDKQKREELQKNAYNYVLDNKSANNLVPQLYETYLKIYEGMK